ncbi:hypothetical protein BW733_04395 [Tessaracoccus flavescens]|uniref:DUF3151 domain-containing protein n=2 Tax=Tessaracoccus flavescens TaxID=399497 RepID=A0A1Q2D282_9ACTN|nr:hypothetical protein BW733_04395 [Tessaracoccus flavescens]
MASDVVVRLPEDPALASISEHGRDHFLQVVADNPGSSLVWALLAETCLTEDDLGNSIAAYAYARTGYHRGLDTLRRNGWKGSGQVPWEHEPNRGFLRALWALSVAAGRIGEAEEQERCAQFLRDSSEEAYQVLAGETEAQPSPEE